LLLLSISFAQAQTSLPDFPLADWLRGPNRSDFPWKVRIRGPWLTFQQRHTVQVHADFRQRDLRKQGISVEDLHFILKVAPENQDWLPEHAYTHAEITPEFGNELESVATFYARPGKYRVAVIAYDAKTQRGNVWHSHLNVPGVKGDPLPDADRSLPIVQFLPQATTMRSPSGSRIHRVGFDASAFGSGKLNLPVRNDRLIQLDLLVNLSLSDAANFRDRQAPDWLYQINADTLLQMSNVLSQLSLKNGCIRVSAIDVLRQETFLDRADAAFIDWDKLSHQVKELQRVKISAGVLANQKRTADVFAAFVENLLDGPGCQSPQPALHVLVVVGDAFLFPTNTDRRALRVRNESYGFYFKLMPIGAGNWDQLESVLKPIHPSHFEFSSSVRFRRALASFIDKLQILSRSAPSNASSDR
jgi:hypothetical protein